MHKILYKLVQFRINKQNLLKKQLKISNIICRTTKSQAKKNQQHLWFKIVLDKYYKLQILDVVHVQIYYYL